MAKKKAYLCIDRQHSRDMVVLYPSLKVAQKAMTSDPLIDSICEEDCLDAYILTKWTEVELGDREVVVSEWRPSSYTVPDGPKMLRESLCVAQTHIGQSDDPRKAEHIARLGRVIEECDRRTES